MNYIGNIIRPPNEAESLLLQVTTACSHNKCTFCGAYRDKGFTIKPMEIIEQDLNEAARYYSHTKRLFLCDGDALIIPFERLKEILRLIKAKLPQIRQIGTYANAKSLKRKSLQELKELRSLGLKSLYLGLESGDDEILQKVNKGVNAATQVEQALKAKEAGFKLLVTVLLGLGGTERSQAHAEATGKALTAMNPDHIGALTLMLIPGTPLAEELRQGRFILPSPEEMLRELGTLIRHTDVERAIFSANHASNYLPLQVMLPRDKEETLGIIDFALNNKAPLRPEWMRGL